MLMKIINLNPTKTKEFGFDRSIDQFYTFSFKFYQRLKIRFFF